MLDTRTDMPDSAIGRLLREVSWEGKKVRSYREAGRGLENALTTEVPAALDFLPRSSFLTGVLRTAYGADAARATLIQAAENAQITVRPDDIVLAPSRRSRKDQLIVQPDAAIEADHSYCLVEASASGRARSNPSSWPANTSPPRGKAGRRTPLLLLILGSPPPVKVSGVKPRLSIGAAIDADLTTVSAAVEGIEQSEDVGTARVPDVVAWTTWHAIREVVSDEAQRLQAPDPSTAGTIHRLVLTVQHAIDRHS